MVNIFIAGFIYVGYSVGQYQAELDYYYDEQSELWYEEMSEKYRRI
jgi:hypothetical protein